MNWEPVWGLKEMRLILQGIPWTSSISLFASSILQVQLTQKKVYNLGCDSLKKVHTEKDSVCIWINGKTRLIQKEKEGLTFNLSRANDYNNSSQLHNVAGRPKYML